VPAARLGRRLGLEATMAAYASGDDLVARYDIDVVGDLCTDDRTKLLRKDIPTHPNVLVALLDASGEIESNIMIGGRYSVAQLEALDERSTALLKRIVCTIAMADLFERRPGVHMEMAKAVRERADEYIEKLKSGGALFNVTDDTSHVDASTPQLHGPTSVDINTRNFLAARMSPRFLPSVKSRNPLDRG
jgi:phage gp36-like protein